MKEFNYTMKIALGTGLRASERNKRGKQALVQSTGMVPIEGTLSSLEVPSQIDISTISPAPSFPYPQVFELNEITVLCTATQIYEYANNTLTLKIENLHEGHVWSIADFGNFVVFVNGKQAVYRDGESREYSVDDPYGMSTASGICNYNGQAIVAAPNVEIP